MTPGRNEPQNGDGEHVASEELAELHRLANSRPKSGREAVAKLGALRALERLGRGRRVVPPMPDGWHPMPGSEWEKLDRVYLDEHPEVRRGRYARLHREGLI